jgi:hypothetical protein
MTTKTTKEKKMWKEKTTYQSKNWDKRISEYCAENRKAKAIRKSFTKEQREQIKKDLESVSNFVKQTLINQNNNQRKK